MLNPTSKKANTGRPDPLRSAGILICTTHIIMEMMTEAAFFPSRQSLPVLASVIW